jgi:diguanylate cyclase (GGDEF)-like protein
VVEALNLSFGYTHISIYLLENDYLHLSGQIGYSEELIIEKIHISQGVSGRTIETKKMQYIQDVAKDPAFLRAAPDVTSEICMPLLKENMVLGIPDVEGRIDSPLTQKDADMLDMLAGPIALAVDNARLHAQVKIVAMTDAVSGLSNRHAFEKILRTEIERATRSNAPLSLIMFDLDSFKDYNDTWGHPAGDMRLRAAADLIRNNLRKYDVAARYGGDEFAIILPDTDQEGSILFAKRLLAAAQASAPKPAVKGKPVAGYTLSIGVATFPHDGNTFEALLLAADHAELIAKRFGKNRIVIARDLDK